MGLVRVRGRDHSGLKRFIGRSAENLPAYQCGFITGKFALHFAVLLAQSDPSTYVSLNSVHTVHLRCTRGDSPLSFFLSPLL